MEKLQALIIAITISLSWNSLGFSEPSLPEGVTIDSVAGADSQTFQAKQNNVEALIKNKNQQIDQNLNRKIEDNLGLLFISGGFKLEDGHELDHAFVIGNDFVRAGTISTLITHYTSQPIPSSFTQVGYLFDKQTKTITVSTTVYSEGTPVSDTQTFNPGDEGYKLALKTMFKNIGITVKNAFSKEQKIQLRKIRALLRHSAVH